MARKSLRERAPTHASLFPDWPAAELRPPANDPAPALREKAWRVHELLCAEYQCPISYFHSLDPLSELVSSLLSHRTRNRDSGDAFKALRAALPSWEAVIDAPTERVQALIEKVTWPELKAPRLQVVLRRISELRGDLSLDFLRDLSIPDGQAWLRQLPGVGPKTAAAVLSFSTLRKAALPVDAHHHRVAERLRLIPPRTSLEQAHALLAAQLPPNLSAQEVYDNHEVLMLHGQHCCFHHKPACERCVLAAICPSCRAGPETPATRVPAP